MSFYRNSKKIKEAYYNGKKVKEAYYNGKKVFSSENVLYEANITTSGYVSLPTTYPAGSIVEWTPNTSFLGRFIEYNGQLQQQIPNGETRITALNNFNMILCLDDPANWHIKIIGVN